MQGDDDGKTPIQAKALHKIEYLNLMVYVQIRSWFVEENHLRLLSQCPGDDESLSLSAGQLAHPALGKSFCMCCFHRLPGDREILLPFVTKQAQVWCSSHEHNFEGSECCRQYGRLRHRGNKTSQFFPPDGHYVAIINHDAPGGQSHYPGHALDKR